MTTVHDSGTTPAVAPQSPATATPLIEVRNLRVQLPSRDGIVTAIDGIELTIGRSEIVALVGESGSGKSMTALAIARLLPPTARIVDGEVLLDGVDLLGLGDHEMDRVRGARIAMLFQQPKATLDPTSRVGDQVGEVLRFRRGVGAKDAWKRSIDLLADVGIPEPQRRARAYAHQLSGGMAQRVMTAAAISGGPELLIADEPTTALDVTVQAQILRLLSQKVRDHGLSMLLISHDLGIVSTVADRVVVMYAGKIVEHGPTSQIINHPSHPYTEALMRSSLLIPNDDGRLYAIPGGMPRPGEQIVGCRFRARCQYPDALGIAAKCESAEPGLHTCESGHLCRCWAVEDGLIQLTPADPIRHMVVEQAPTVPVEVAPLAEGAP